MMRPITINGKFYSGSLNGVHRVADRLIRELDRGLAALPAAHRPLARLHVPRERSRTPHLSAIEVIEEPRGHTQFWEQAILPARARGAVLLCLCNLSPLLHPRTLLLLHDVQFMLRGNNVALRQHLGYNLLVPHMARASHRVLTVSQYSRATLDLMRLSSLEHTAVMHNGVDHMLEAIPESGYVERLGLIRNRFAVMFGSRHAYKNGGVVLEAFRQPELANYRLVLVGEDSPNDHRLLPPNILALGRISDAAVAALYAQATCLLCPSRTEGFGLPPLEAMLLGCPAVVAPAGALPEICRDAVLYADVDSPLEWSSATRLLAEDGALRARKIIEGRARAENFTWGRAGAVLLKETLALCGDNSRERG
jgi:glycosyltransferase involved in cell wall biosynthesis